MSEADADNFLLAAVQLAHKFHQGRDPGLVVIDAGFAAGDQVGVNLVYIIGKFALLHIVDHKLQCRVQLSQKRDKHIRILTEFRHPFRPHRVRFQNSKLHDLPAPATPAG